MGGALALVSPDYVGLLFSERIGNFMIVGGLIWMALGVFVMHQMINFEL